jgi:predicted acylesterase/phospholipase RssA
MSKGKVALCLPGGGSRGYSTVGYLKAMVDLGIDYDFISGTSVGAINGAIFHQEGNTDLLEKLWSEIKASDIYSLNLLGAVNPFTKKRAVLSSRPLRKTIDKYLDYSKVKANPKPCYVNTTDYTNWQPLTLDIREMPVKDDMVSFILASASIPMAFDPVPWGKSWLYDGGMVMNTSVQDCIRKGADTIIVLRPVLPQKGKPINSIIDAFSLSMSIPQEYVMDRELITVELINQVQEASPDLHHVEVVVVQPPVPPSWDILDFSFGGKARQAILEDAYNLAYPILKRAFT